MRNVVGLMLLTALAVSCGSGSGIAAPPIAYSNSDSGAVVGDAVPAALGATASPTASAVAEPAAVDSNSSTDDSADTLSAPSSAPVIYAINITQNYYERSGKAVVPERRVTTRGFRNIDKNASAVSPGHALDVEKESATTRVSA